MNTVSLIAAIVLAVVIALVIGMAWIAPGKSRQAAEAREHERLTGWFTAIRDPGQRGPVILRDEDGVIILPRNLIKGTGGRHRLEDRLTSQEISG